MGVCSDDLTLQNGFWIIDDVLIAGDGLKWGRKARNSLGDLDREMAPYVLFHEKDGFRAGLPDVTCRWIVNKKDVIAFLDGPNYGSSIGRVI